MITIGCFFTRKAGCLADAAGFFMSRQNSRFLELSLPY
ncbi:hypothetical protein SB48_HM08orf03944 [Heyndrickxia coagulans]|uniref:Uncharacterized protein n=1 Tax=Heyndrickxia coagulans TaxID=1398 RepID=A0AAN0WCP1_HEYCO|nr:hypothetical protein SB48_HM08orf03944 [Heyndrickxia coagulans]